MNRATPVLAGLLGSLLAVLASCSASSATASSLGASCASNTDCSGGAVCGYANVGGDDLCSARGVCVVPVDEQPTNLCGCGGAAIEIVVNDVDAGIYYWSGVIVGEKGFPPCGDAAVAPSSNASADASGAGDDAAADVSAQ
jgi:hypothetical protein